MAGLFVLFWLVESSVALRYFVLFLVRDGTLTTGCHELSLFCVGYLR